MPQHLPWLISDTKLTSVEVEKHMKETVDTSEQGKEDMHHVNDANA